MLLADALCEWYHRHMETVKKRKKNLFFDCPAAHIAAVISALVIIAHLALRSDTELMAKLSETVVRPSHRVLAVFWSHIGFSAAECLIALFAVSVIAYIVYKLIRIVRGRDRLRQAYSALMTLIAAGLFVYALFCVLWGVSYYGDDFETMSGIKAEKISTQQLETVTRYFAARLNEYGEAVRKDENGLYAVTADELIEKSPEVFSVTEKRFACLEGPDIAVKGVHFSRVMSYLDFTGFFFPFTAEANVNTDCPTSSLAATIAHELSHQRGVAKEQEANFTAVMACLDYGDIDYCYSACRLAYIHLGNALYGEDREAWAEIYGDLSDFVKRDLKAESEYWRQFETPVQTVSNAVYEGFLQSYNQELGLKSYGACVDLLVCYYEAQAAAYFENIENE